MQVATLLRHVCHFGEVSWLGIATQSDSVCVVNKPVEHGVGQG